MSKKYFIKTFGCAMNYSDSERIASFLEKNNYQPTSNIDEASLVIFNTCGVRQMAEDRVYGQIHNIKKQDTRNPPRLAETACRREAGNNQTKVVLTGCLANRKDVQRRLKNKVDLFFPINEFGLFENWFIENSIGISNFKFHPPRRTNQVQISNEKLQKKSSADLELQSLSPSKESIAYFSIMPKHSNEYQALVPIMTGCNNFCAYCVVPYARGREISRPASEIIAEVKDLAEKEFKEIILLGQNVNSYSDGEINFSKLLKKIDTIPGKFWIRFVSNHPKDVTEKMIETVTKCKKVCESFHLPIQAGNDAILKKMNRRYTAKEFLATAKKIQAAFKKNKPGVPSVITSDIIVGFPGETKKQFLDSSLVMEKVGFDMVYFGQFSPRPGTAAWKMKDNVSKKEKGRREQFLNEILKKSALKNSKRFLNTKTEVLIDKKSDDFYFGKTRTGKNVKIVSKKKNLVGKIIKAKIIKVSIWNLEGTL